MQYQNIRGKKNNATSAQHMSKFLGVHNNQID